jgi:hypothetical protein
MFSMPRRGRFSMKGEKSLEGWSGRSTAGNREDRCSKVVRLPQWALLKVGDGVAEEGNRRRRWAGGGGGAEENGSFNQRESGGSKDGERWDAWKVPICLTKDSFRLRETNASQGNFFTMRWIWSHMPRGCSWKACAVDEVGFFPRWGETWVCNICSAEGLPCSVIGRQDNSCNL